MNRDDAVAVGDAQATLRRLDIDEVLKPPQRVDHRVAHEVHELGGYAFPSQMPHGFRAGHEVHVGQGIRHDAVDLLRHRAVEAPEARLDVGNGDVQLRGANGSGQSRVDVAIHDDTGGTPAFEELLESYQQGRRLCPVRAGADPKILLWFGKPELVEENVRHRGVVVLARVDEDRTLPHSLQRANHRRSLHEIGPSANDVDVIAWHRHILPCEMVSPPREQSPAAGGRRRHLALPPRTPRSLVALAPGLPIGSAPNT